MEDIKKGYQDPLRISNETYLKGIRTTLETIQKIIPRHNIVGEVAELRGHSEAALSKIESKDHNTEIYALAGHFAEHVWERVEGWLKEHPGELGTLFMDDKLHVEKFQTVPHRILYEQFERNPRDGFEKIAEFTDDTVRHIATEYFDEVTDLIKEIDPLISRDKIFEKKALQRYTDLLLDSDRHRTNFGGKPMSHVLAGLRVANSVSWTLIASLPHTFEETFQRAPTKEEFDELLKVTRGLVLYLATLELSVFTPTVIELFPTKQSASDHTPYARGLTIKKDGNSFRVDFDINALTTVVGEVHGYLRDKNWEEKSLRYGCPAIAARSSEGKNLVVEIFDWSANLTKKFYAPHLKENS